MSGMPVMDPACGRSSSTCSYIEGGQVCTCICGDSERYGPVFMEQIVSRIVRRVGLDLKAGPQRWNYDVMLQSRLVESESLSQTVLISVAL